MLSRLLAVGSLGLTLGGLALLSHPGHGAAFGLTGDALGLDQRDVRVFNNFVEATANDNQTPDPDLPGALGAQLADPDAVVVGLTGDGGFNMVLGELETARRMKLGVNIIVVNNAASGYVKALQHLMYGEGNYQSSDLEETNYANLANAMGCHGIRVEQPKDIVPALQAAFAETDRPSVIDVMVTRDPAKMLPAVDNRTVQVKKGDRVA